MKGDITTNPMYIERIKGCYDNNSMLTSLITKIKWTNFLKNKTTELI